LALLASAQLLCWVQKPKDGLSNMYDLHNQLVHWATITPEHSSIVEAETGRSMTYSHCFSAVQKMRQFLGVQPRNLMLTLSGGIADAVLWLSALTGGHMLVPLAPDAAEEERKRAVSMYKPDVLFVEQPEEAQGFPGASDAQIVTRQECELLIEHTRTEHIAPLPSVKGHVCLMTSGTTGEPKGVILNEYQIAWTADHVRTSHQLSPDDRGLTVLPFFHVNGPVVGLCASIMAGSTIVIARKFSRSHFWSWIEAYEVTWASIVPTIVAILLGTSLPAPQAGLPAFRPGALRFIRTGAAALPATDLRAFEAKFGIPLIETYGLTEAASEVTANPVPPGRHKPGSAGLPVGVSLRICRPRNELIQPAQHPDGLRPNCVQADCKEYAVGDDRMHDVPRGETGEICISGPSVISAYYGNADKEAFQDGWFRTGDIGYQDEEDYLYITGRLRDVIIRGGENIAPREVEEVLETYPAVREAAVIGRPDAVYGEQVVAYIVLNGPMTPQLAQTLHEYAARRLSAHKVPVGFIAVDSLPKNALGKVEHRLLQERDARSDVAAGTRLAAPGRPQGIAPTQDGARPWGGGQREAIK
jgi:acyl-CoA synthetase (AMP-forming)/AMP-acid ligase II